MKVFPKFAGALLFVAALTVPAHAGRDQGLLQERVKVALNAMVQDVKSAETPSAKREVLNRFLNKAKQSSRIAERLPFLSPENHAALEMLHARFGGYQAELQGRDLKGPLADNDLDGFASFMQQDLEQAGASWGSGGIYLSTGAVIIILLILLLIT